MEKLSINNLAFTFFLSSSRYNKKVSEIAYLMASKIVKDDFIMNFSFYWYSPLYPLMF